MNVLSTVILTAALSVAGQAQTAQQYQDVSNQLAVDAESLIASAPEDAKIMFERALVANPANMSALLGLARTLDVMGRPGRSLKYYRQALSLEPDNVTALAAQAKAFLKRDLVDRAEVNQLRLAELCGSCDAALDVAQSISDYKDRQAMADASESQGEEG